MGRIEDYVEAVTRRLRPDAELHMDIAHEVRAHLEDAMSEARSRGVTDQEAVEQALKAFGVEDEVGEGLWQANRRRMRLRAVLKWAARVILVPAALVLTVFLVSLHLPTVSGAVRAMVNRGSIWSIFGRLPALRPKKGLSDDQLFIFEHLAERLSDAKALLERYPNDPVFYANYVGQYTDRWVHPERMNSDELNQTLSIVERGESIEPDNAFYDYLKAALLMEHSSRLVEDEGLSYTYLDRRGERRERSGGRLLIEERGMFEQAIREVLEGIRKPYYESHEKNKLELKLELMEPLATIEHQIASIGEAAARLMPHLQPMRQMMRRLPPFAVVLASEGDTERALELVEVMNRPAVQMGAGAESAIELLVARAGLGFTRGQAPGIYEMMGMPEAAAQARERFENEINFWNSLWSGSRERIDAEEYTRTFGIIAGGLVPVLPVEELTWVPELRKTEHIVLQRWALAGMTLALSLPLVTLGILALWNLWRRRGRADGPKLFFVGWKRLGLIVSLGLILPVGLYWVYTRLTPFSSMRYGINYCPGRIALEMSLVLALVILTVMAMGYQAIRARCRDAGMDVPPAGFFIPFRSLGATFGSAAAAIVLVVAFAAGIFYVHGKLPLVLRTLLIATGMVVFALAFVCSQFWLLRRREPERAHFRMTFARSLVPILAACLLAVGLASHAYLRFAEAGHIRQLNQPGRRFFVDELEMTSLKKYRDHLRELNRGWDAQAEFGGHAGPQGSQRAAPERL